MKVVGAEDRDKVILSTEGQEGKHNADKKITEASEVEAHVNLNTAKFYPVKSRTGKTIHDFYIEADCGLIHRSISGWNHTVRSKNNKNGVNGWSCRYCTGNWSGKKGGTRLIQLWTSTVCLQIIADEPPQAPYLQWQKERIEFYKRLEPCEPLRNEPLVRPRTTRTAATLRVAGPLSDAVWQAVHTNPSSKVMEQLENMARHEALALYG